MLNNDKSPSHSVHSLLLSVLRARSAGRRTLKVPETHATIQRAILEAGPGDTVEVAAGVYRESVHIPPAQQGLKLVARGLVAIDARPSGIEGAGPGIWNAASNVLIRGFTICHARRVMPGAALPGSGVYSTGNDVTLENLTIIDCADGGIEVAGTGSDVRCCTVEAEAAA